MESRWSDKNSPGGIQLPESPIEPMEFLSRSWSSSAFKVCKALAPSPSPTLPFLHNHNKLNKLSANNYNAIPEISPCHTEEEESAKISSNTFSFASSATSQLVLERIMAQSVCNVPRRIVHYNSNCGLFLFN